MVTSKLGFLTHRFYMKRLNFLSRTGIFFKSKKLFPLGMLATFLAGCSGDPQINGKRELFIAPPSDISVNSATQAKAMHWQASFVNREWLQSCFSAQHTMPHFDFDEVHCKWLWKEKFGSRARSYAQLITNLVVKNGMLFGGDAGGHIVAFDLNKQTVAWSLYLGGTSNDIAKIGGLALLANGDLVATTSDGSISLIDLQTRSIKKTKNIHCSIRSAPCVSGDQIFFQSSNNCLFKMDANLNLLWSQNETPENVVFLGSSGPAMDGHTLIAAYSDGEYKAYDPISGEEIWNDFLISHSQDDTVANMLQIYASPVITNPIALVLGNGGKLTANDMVSGEHLWNLEITGLHTPAVVEDWIFAIDSDARAYCIEKSTGNIRWCSSILFPATKTVIKNWTSPLVAGNAMITILNDGTVVFLSITNGKVLRTIKTKAYAPAAAIIVDKTLYVLSSSGVLYAFG